MPLPAAEAAMAVLFFSGAREDALAVDGAVNSQINENHCTNTSILLVNIILCCKFRGLTVSISIIPVMY